MTVYWRRQTQSGGNYPPTPPGSPGVPFFPQTLAPSTVIGRLAANTGPTEAIPFAFFLAALQSAVTIQTITTSGSHGVNSDTQLLIINKAIASATPLTLPTVVGRNLLQLEIYDWTGLAGDITLTPQSGQTVMGLSAWTVGSGGVTGSGGSLKLLPIVSLLGWLVR